MFSATSLDSSHVVYVEAMKTSKVYARDVTTISPVMLCLFGSRLKIYEVIKRGQLSFFSDHSFASYVCL